MKARCANCGKAAAHGSILCLKCHGGQGLLQQYLDLGASYSVMAQHDTPEQKQIICESGFISEPDDTGARTLAK